MKALILQLVAAFVALVHTDSDDKDAIATLKGQLGDLTNQLTQAQAQAASGIQFTDDERAQITAAGNLLGAAAPAPAAEVQAVAQIPPDTTAQAGDIPAVSDSVPANVAAAAATAPVAGDPNATTGS